MGLCGCDWVGGGRGRVGVGEVLRLKGEGVGMGKERGRV